MHMFIIELPGIQDVYACLITGTMVPQDHLHHANLFPSSDDGDLLYIISVILK